MYDKFRGCTVDVQSATGFETTVGKTLHYVYTLNVCHDNLHDVSVIE